MTSLKTSIKTITYLSDIGCLEIQGASLLVDQIVSLLVTGNTNDRQLKALFNYVLQTGDAQRFRAFIGEIAERAPQEKEKLMTIADRLREEGAMQGKHEEALRIAQEMLDRGLDRELVMMVTRLSPDDLIAQSH
ncbi:hypothetical protein ESCOMM145B2_08385 [Escherichia coli]